MLNRRTFLSVGASGIAAAGLGCVTPPRAAPTSGRFADLSGFCDASVPLSREDHALHVKKIQAGLVAAELDALIIEPGPTMFYASGVRWGRSERPFLVIVPAEGTPWWISPAFEADRARERAGDSVEIRLWQEHEDPYGLVAKGLSGNRVAVDPGMRHFLYAGLSRALAPREVVNGKAVVQQARITKNAKELALLDRANQATKAALAAVAPMAHVGMRESELRTLLREAQSEAGLSDIWALVLFGPNAAFPHGTGQERTLQAGDLILVDTGGKLHGYCSDITRTWSVGPVPDESRRTWEVVHAAQAAAFERIGPGVACRDVDAAAREVITKAGFGADYAAFVHRLGHGIGLQGHEDPYLVAGNDLILQPGMTMSNEPGIYLSGKIGVRIEDILAITDDGYRVFGSKVESFDRPM